jgi:Icc-related predicted phosphoesterase
MKLLCVSDIVAPQLYHHFDAKRFNQIDLVISCGDLPPEYLVDLLSTFNVPVYYVRGNHDIRYKSKPPGGCTNLHGRIVRHGPLKILGLEGSRWYNGGPNQYTESQMRHLVWRLRPKLWWQGGADLIVTHAPPRFIHDAEDPCHRGFRTFRQLIHWYAPRFFLHGHIHKHFKRFTERVTWEGATRVINCCGYCLVEIDVDSMDSKT